MKKFLFLIFYWLLVPLAFATNGGTESTGKTELGNKGLKLFELESPLESKTIEQLLDQIILTITIIATPIAVLMIIVGAFQMLTAGGDPEKFSKGKKTILYAAIGFAILLIAGLLIRVVSEILGVRVLKVTPVGPGAEF